MIKRIFAAIVVISMISSCTDGSEKTSKETGKPIDSTLPAGDTVLAINDGTKMCFANFNNDDTIILSYVKTDTTITGKLLYNLDEKDRNIGDIKGVMRGDTLIADYMFMSEGINSVRQVVFLKQGEGVVEGFGSVNDDHGRVVYEDLSKLAFDKSVTLKPVNCETLPSIK